MTGVAAALRGTVTRLDPQRRTVTLRVPGGSFLADTALPGEGLAPLLHCDYGQLPRPVGTVRSVMPAGEATAEVVVHVVRDRTWRRLAEEGVRVGVAAEFAHVRGADPRGGRVVNVEID